MVHKILTIYDKMRYAMATGSNPDICAEMDGIKNSNSPLGRFIRVSCLSISLVIFGMAGVVSKTAMAQSDVGRLDEFIQSLNSFQADFEQTLYDGNSQPLKTSTGSIRLKRPGRFVWTYETPEEQVIVADGSRIWLYDKDLEQVTVNAIDERLAGTPLQLLMSASSITESFDVEALGNSDNIDWFELLPKTEQSDFESVFIGLNDQGLAAMELRDNFGQATQILFFEFDVDVPIDDSVFVFDVPEGVDVIGMDEQ